MMSPIFAALISLPLRAALPDGAARRSSILGFTFLDGVTLEIEEAAARLEAPAKPRPGLVRLDPPALPLEVHVGGLEIAVGDARLAPAARPLEEYVPRLDVAVDDELLADVLLPPANDTEEASPHAEAAVCTHCKGGTRRTKGICTGCTGYAVNAYIDGADVLGISDLTEPARIAACYQLAGLLKDRDISEPTVLGVEKLINRILRGAEGETSVRCRAQLRLMRTGEVS